MCASPRSIGISARRRTSSRRLPNSPAKRTRRDPYRRGNDGPAPKLVRAGKGNDMTWLFALFLALSVLAGAAAAEEPALPKGFVHLREVAPTIRQDMRYAGTFNFTGARVPGYRAAE